MSRENAQAKARRYLAEGRLVVGYVGRGRLPGDGLVVDATCRGDGAVYHLAVRAGVWSCDCPARSRCAHLLALGLVTAPGATP